MEDITVHNLQLIAQSHKDKLSNRQYLQKFEVFLVSLTFTVLGLSIQTAKFHDNPAINIFELSAWLFFLISGILALFKLKKFHSYFLKYDYTLKLHAVVRKEDDEDILLDEIKLKTLSILQWFFFIFGFLALIVSRGYEPFLKILGL